MRRLDRHKAITFVDIVAEDAACPLERAQMLGRLHASEQGRISSGAAAFAAMWRAIPVLRPFGLAARNRWVLAMLERLYRAFLHVRPALQAMARRVAGEEGA